MGNSKSRKLKTLSFRIDADLAEFLKKYSEETRIPQVALIERAIELLIGKRKPARPKKSAVRKVNHDFLVELQKEYPIIDVEATWVRAQNYCKANGKRYKDYQAFLRNWVDKDAADKKYRSGFKKGGVADARKSKEDNHVY